MTWREKETGLYEQVSALAEIAGAVRKRLRFQSWKRRTFRAPIDNSPASASGEKRDDRPSKEAKPKPSQKKKIRGDSM